MISQCIRENGGKVRIYFKSKYKSGRQYATLYKTKPNDYSSWLIVYDNMVGRPTSVLRLFRQNYSTIGCVRMLISNTQGVGGTSGKPWIIFLYRD